MLPDEGAVGGQALRAVAHALEPSVEPADDLAVEVCGGDPGNVGILVLPWPNQRLGGRGQVRGERRGRIDVGVGPAADGQHRRLDGLPVLAHGPMPPIGVAGGMIEPASGEERQRLDPLDPAFAPVAAQRRIGWAGLVGEHLRAPVEVVGQQAAAHVVDVVRVAIHGGAAGDDRLQRRWAAKGELQAVEPAPGDSDHSDVAVAPRLARDPGNDRLSVAELLLRVLVVEDAVRIPGARDIDPDAGIARRGEYRMGGGVARRGAVTPAVRQILQNGGGGHTRLRPPDSGGEAPAVRELDPGIVRRYMRHRDERLLQARHCASGLGHGISQQVSVYNTHPDTPIPGADRIHENQHRTRRRSRARGIFAHRGAYQT